MTRSITSDSAPEEVVSRVNSGLETLTSGAKSRGGDARSGGARGGDARGGNPRGGDVEARMEGPR